MKILIRILIITVVFYISFTVLAQQSLPPEDDIQDQSQYDFPESPAKEKTFRAVKEENPEVEDDDFISYYEHEVFSDKLYQKKLSPLDRKDKIIWSFRMAEANFFL